MEFKKHFEELMKWECGKGNGYVSDKLDKGGETCYGLCRKFHSGLMIWDSLDTLPNVKEKKAYEPKEEEMREVIKTYKKNYWDMMWCDKITDDRIAHYVFDMAVNVGCIKAAKIVQTILGISIDGKVGAQTINAINRTHSKSLLNALIKARSEFYNAIVAKDGTQGKFLKGWLRRCENCVDWIS